MPINYRKSRRVQYSPLTANPNIDSKRNLYAREGSGIRRHEVSFGVSGTPAALLPNEYVYASLLKFARTFGATDDTDPTPTASNNYQTGSVMNGSKVVNFEAIVNIKNRSSSVAAYLDVYTLAVSFWDVLVWNTILPSACPVTIDTTTVGPPDIRGAISNKAITATLITENQYKNYKLVQHYMKKVGTIYLATTDGGQSSAQLKLPLPAKCVRSNSGMAYQIYLHNDTTKNAAATLAIDATVDLSFDELPASNRMPFIT